MAIRIQPAPQVFRTTIFFPAYIREKRVRVEKKIEAQGYFDGENVEYLELFDINQEKILGQMHRSLIYNNDFRKTIIDSLKATTKKKEVA